MVFDLNLLVETGGLDLGLQSLKSLSAGFEVKELEMLFSLVFCCDFEL